MLKQFIRLSVAAVFIAASTGAHAIKLVSGPTVDPDVTSMDSVTYAKETLLKTSAKEPDNITFYDIQRTHYVSGPTKIYTLGAANDAYVVRYSLEGMVFAAQPTGHALGRMNDVPGVIATPGDTISEGDGFGGRLNIILGGAAGDDYVVFQAVNLTIRRTDGVVADLGNNVAGVPVRDPIILLQAKFAISGEGSGSITRVVQNRALRDIGIPDSETHELSGAIRALPALVEKVVPDASPPTAVAAFDFMQFSPGSRISQNLDQSVGSVMLGVQSNPEYRHSQGTDTEVAALATAIGDNSPEEEVRTAMLLLVVDTLEEVIGGETDPKKNGATFSSNYFQFPSKVTVGAAAGGCDAGGSDIRMKSAEDANVYENASKPQTAASFKGEQILCINVDGETEIPVTDTYKVTTKYAGVADAAFPPPGGTYELAYIRHDGTTYRLPYLTTYEAYNQRFSIVNRGGATTYAFTGLVSAEGTVTPGPRSIGPLPTGQTILRTEDVVSIAGAARAAGNLTIVADPGTVSAAVQQINTMTRTVDTVYLEHMLQ